MAIEPFQNLEDRQTDVVIATNQISPAINALLQQFHTHAFTYSKETLVDLVPYLREEDNYYNLGAVLHHIQIRFGRKVFTNTLIENEISFRTAAYIMAIYVKFNSLKIPCPLDVPWRTLGEAVRIINAINYQEIIDFCRTSSADEVRAYIREGEK